jgi:hypothetical protein
MSATAPEMAAVPMTDLVGSTAMADRVGPVAAEELRTEHFGLLRGALERTGGREVKNLGDGLMVVFSSASESLACAVAMQQAVEARNRRAEEQPARRPRSVPSRHAAADPLAAVARPRDSNSRAERTLKRAMSSTRASRAAIALFTALLAFAAPAAATTVGGFSTSADGAFVLSAGRLMLPTFSTDNMGEAGPYPPVTTTDIGVRSFGPDDRHWRYVTLDQSAAGAGVPAIAARGATSAAAWIGASGLESALLGARAAHTSAMHAAGGKVGDFDVAVGAGGTRAVAWSDDTGTHIQVVSGAGVPPQPVPVSPASAQTVTVTADDSGGWWVVMVAGGRLTTIDVSAAGGAGPPVDLASSAASAGAPGHLLGDRSWLALADGHGGLWVGLPHALLHVTGTTRSRALATGGFLALADGDRASALAQDAGRGDIVVRTIGARLGRAIRLRHAGFVIDIAFDAPRRAIELLAGEPHGVVRLSEISTAGHVRRSQTLAYCRNRQSGQVEASGGLIAVSCAGRNFDAENVQTGGDEQHGRNNLYLLLRAGRKLRGNSYFEGSYAY